MSENILNSNIYFYDLNRFIKLDFSLSTTENCPCKWSISFIKLIGAFDSWLLNTDERCFDQKSVQVLDCFKRIPTPSLISVSEEWEREFVKRSIIINKLLHNLFFVFLKHIFYNNVKLPQKVWREQILSAPPHECPECLPLCLISERIQPNVFQPFSALSNIIVSFFENHVFPWPTNFKRNIIATFF